ncbi:MAG: FecR domain-containing protein [Mucilaginibacter sp.]|nr:FecR domain-containing protein [Mucilaginibacter sp.]
MRKFTFLRKKIEAKDRALQENLVQKYFDELELGNEADANDFDRDTVYSRITDQIDAMPARKNNVKKRWISAASVIVVLATSGLLYQHKYEVMDMVSPIAQKQLATGGSQVASFTLSDGTKVWLNGDSKMAYPETFRGETREITITGEAFLEVAHDDKMPFIVRSGDVRTQVLGTSFNVKAYPKESFVKVDVATGKVGVMAPSNKTVFLTPKQEVLFDKKTHTATTVANIDISALSGWKEGNFIVKNMPLSEVLNVIQRRFAVQVKADANLSQCSITANFTNVSLQNVMKIVAKLVKGKAQQSVDGNSYKLTGKGC